jgi:hypothetical protein
LRPSKWPFQHPFLGIPKRYHGAVFDIIEDLSMERVGSPGQRSAATVRLDSRSRHDLTADWDGWTSVDLLGRADSMRFLYRYDAGGLKWRIANTH